MPITIHLVTKNNQPTVERTLQSLMPLNGQILVADLGSKDRTPEICAAYGAKVHRLSLNDDYSQVRNRLLALSKTKWNLYLEPWEVMLGGHETILQQPVGIYRFQIIQGDLVTKQTRLWHAETRCQFVNPVFETILKPAQDLPVCVYAANVDRSQESMRLIEAWKQKNPVAIEPYYYQASVLLSQRNWDEFLTTADHYLFRQQKTSMARTMTLYYRSLVLCYVKKDYREAIKPLIECLAEKPLMAEFWCLLGDIYYASKEYRRARSFYENAILLGSRRPKEDDWPLEIQKYKEHPTKMLNSCDQIMKNSTIFAG